MSQELARARVGLQRPPSIFHHPSSIVASNAALGVDPAHDSTRVDARPAADVPCPEMCGIEKQRR
jgi:hypothetical protein